MFTIEQIYLQIKKEKRAKLKYSSLHISALELKPEVDFVFITIFFILFISLFFFFLTCKVHLEYLANVVVLKTKSYISIPLEDK